MSLIIKNCTEYHLCQEIVLDPCPGAPKLHKSQWMHQKELQHDIGLKMNDNTVKTLLNGNCSDKITFGSDKEDDFVTNQLPPRMGGWVPYWTVTMHVGHALQRKPSQTAQNTWSERQPLKDILSNNNLPSVHL